MAAVSDLYDAEWGMEERLPWGGEAFVYISTKMKSDYIDWALLINSTSNTLSTWRHKSLIFTRTRNAVATAPSHFF